MKHIIRLIAAACCASSALFAALPWHSQTGKLNLAHRIMLDPELAGNNRSIDGAKVAVTATVGVSALFLGKGCYNWLTKKPNHRAAAQTPTASTITSDGIPQPIDATEPTSNIHRWLDEIVYSRTLTTSSISSEKEPENYSNVSLIRSTVQLPMSSETRSQTIQTPRALQGHDYATSPIQLPVAPCASTQTPRTTTRDAGAQHTVSYHDQLSQYDILGTDAQTETTMQQNDRATSPINWSPSPENSTSRRTTPRLPQVPPLTFNPHDNDDRMLSARSASGNWTNRSNASSEPTHGNRNALLARITQLKQQRSYYFWQWLATKLKPHASCATQTTSTTPALTPSAMVAETPRHFDDEEAEEFNTHPTSPSSLDSEDHEELVFLSSMSDTPQATLIPTAQRTSQARPTAQPRNNDDVSQFITWINQQTTPPNNLEIESFIGAITNRINKLNCHNNTHGNPQEKERIRALISIIQTKIQSWNLRNNQQQRISHLLEKLHDNLPPSITRFSRAATASRPKTPGRSNTPVKRADTSTNLAPKSN